MDDELEEIRVKECEYPVFDAKLCEYCGQCVSACPHQALSLT
jgi:formate hydrogenlyase subunit 6/NADH:ubiquinone oxidoreductase subunit I